MSVVFKAFFGVIPLRVDNPELLGSWCIEVTNESTLVIDLLAALMHHDLSYLGLLIPTIIPKKYAYRLYINYRSAIPERVFKGKCIQCDFREYSFFIKCQMIV